MLKFILYYYAERKRKTRIGAGLQKAKKRLEEPITPSLMGIHPTRDEL